MIKQDYIMRMIEQLVKALSKIFFNKKTGNHREALQNIENTFSSLLGLDYKLLEISSADNIVSLLELQGDITALNIKYIVIAKLLKESAEIKSLNDSKNFNPAIEYKKALTLFLEGFLNNNNKDVPLNEYYKDVEELADKLGNNLSSDEKAKLMKFYEITGIKNKSIGTSKFLLL